MNDDIIKIIKIFFIWLAILLSVGFFSTHLSIYKEGTCNIKNQLPYYKWDSFWYTSISRHGYTFSEQKNSSIAFFPLYPMVIRAVRTITRLPQDYISFGLNIIFSFLSSLYLYRLARFDYNEKKSLAILVVFLFFPPAYFFVSGYPEALFVLLGIASLYFARKGHWAKAGIASGLLAITKPYGIFMFPVLMLEYLWSSGWDLKVFYKKINWTPLLLPLFSFAGFVLFNYLKFGDPIAFLKTQKTWGRSLDNPMVALIKEFDHYIFGGHILSGSNFPYVVYLLSFVFSIFALFVCWKRVRKTYLVFSGLLLLSALLTGTLTSWGRYMLLAFPILFGPAIYFSQKKWVFYLYFFVSASVMIFCASYFVRCFPFE
ncbi:MAG: hypothetical protein WCI36_02660 [bacterium]